MVWLFISLVVGFALCWGDLWWPFQMPRGGCCCSTLFFGVPDVLSSGANGIIYPSHVLAGLWCPLRKILSLPVVVWVLPSAGPNYYWSCSAGFSAGNDVVCIGI
ncbi:hypothetical protein U1Q18_043633 [Sarracenia purpurea var. burkii]